MSPDFIDYKVYPNPVSTTLTVSFSEFLELGAEIILSDLTGKQIIKRHATSNYEYFDVQNLPSGTYLLSTIVGNNIDVKKLIIN